MRTTPTIKNRFRFDGGASSGFTIVELLIVIAVIAILAAISIVAYRGVTKSAETGAVQSALAQAQKKLALFAVDNTTYPVNQAAFLSVVGSSNATYTYTVNASVAAPNYCVSALQGSTTYYLIQDGTVTKGACPNMNGLVAWWRLNSDTKDASGNGYDGVNNGATITTGQNGGSGGAYSFNGSSNYIGITTSQALPTATGTISLWVRSINNGLIQNFFFYGSDLEDGCTGFPAIVIASCGFTLQSGTNAVNPSLPNIADNQWHHIIGVWNASNSTVIVYIDGAQYSTSSLSFTPTFPQQAVTIGKPSSNTRYTYGSIDDVRVYDRALSASEVQAVYTAGAQ